MRMQDLKISSNAPSQDLKISSNATSQGLYHQIYSHEDFKKFLTLCKSLHSKAHEYTSAGIWSPTNSNISEYLKTECFAYISGVTGVVGVTCKNRLSQLEGYHKMTLSNKLVLHNAVKHYKE